MKNKNENKRKNQLLSYKMILALLIFTLLNVLSYKYSSKFLNFISAIPAILMIITVFQSMMK